MGGRAPWLVTVAVAAVVVGLVVVVVSVAVASAGCDTTPPHDAGEAGVEASSSKAGVSADRTDASKGAPSADAAAPSRLFDYSFPAAWRVCDSDEDCVNVGPVCGGAAANRLHSEEASRRLGEWISAASGVCVIPHPPPIEPLVECRRGLCARVPRKLVVSLVTERFRARGPSKVAEQFLHGLQRGLTYTRLAGCFGRAGTPVQVIEGSFTVVIRSRGADRPPRVAVRALSHDDPEVRACLADRVLRRSSGLPSELRSVTASFEYEVVRSE